MIPRIFQILLRSAHDLEDGVAAVIAASNNRYLRLLLPRVYRKLNKNNTIPLQYQLVDRLATSFQIGRQINNTHVLRQEFFNNGVRYHTIILYPDICRFRPF